MTKQKKGAITLSNIQKVIDSITRCFDIQDIPQRNGLITKRDLIDGLIDILKDSKQTHNYVKRLQSWADSGVIFPDPLSPDEHTLIAVNGPEELQKFLWETLIKLAISLDGIRNVNDAFFNASMQGKLHKHWKTAFDLDFDFPRANLSKVFETVKKRSKKIP